jgi:DNA-binding NtrC family response regulator
LSSDRYVPTEREGQLLSLVQAAIGVIEGCAQSGTLSIGGLSLRAVEREAIVQTLRLTAGNQTVAADLLGIERKSLYNKMRRHGLLMKRTFQTNSEEGC